MFKVKLGIPHKPFASIDKTVVLLFLVGLGSRLSKLSGMGALLVL